MARAVSARRRRRTQKRPVSPKKARQILREGEIGGRPLTERQRRFFGFLAGGGVPTRVRAGRVRKRGR